MFWRAWELWIGLCGSLSVCFDGCGLICSVHLDYDSTNPPGHLR